MAIQFKPNIDNLNVDCRSTIDSFLPPTDLAIASRVSHKWHDTACKEAQKRSEEQGFGFRSAETALKDLQVTQYYPEGVIKAIGLDRILNSPQLQPSQLNRIFKDFDSKGWAPVDRLSRFDIERHPDPLSWGKDVNGKRFIFFHVQEKNDTQKCKDVGTCNIWQDTNWVSNQPVPGPFIGKGDPWPGRVWDHTPFHHLSENSLNSGKLEAIKQIFNGTHQTLRPYSGLDFPEPLIEAIGLPRIRNSPYLKRIIHYKYSAPIASQGPLVWGRNANGDPCISFYIESKEDPSKFIQYWVWKSRWENSISHEYESGPYLGRGQSGVVDNRQMRKEFGPFCDYDRILNPELLEAIKQIFAGTHETLQLYSAKVPGTVSMLGDEQLTNRRAFLTGAVPPLESTPAFFKT